MKKTLQFIFDFGSPNAYLAYRALPPLLQRTESELEIIPCLLGGIFKATNNQPPMLAFANVRGKMSYEQTEIKRFIQQHRLEKFSFNSHFPVNTLLLMRGAIAAKQDGRLSDYLEMGLAAMWEDDKKMDDPGVFSQTLNAAGFDAADYLQRMQTPELKATLMRNTEQAVERGVFGVPSFFVDDQMYFGKERLAQIEQHLSMG